MCKSQTELSPVCGSESGVLPQLQHYLGAIPAWHPLVPQSLFIRSEMGAQSEALQDPLSANPVQSAQSNQPLHLQFCRTTSVPVRHAVIATCFSGSLSPLPSLDCLFFTGFSGTIREGSHFFGYFAQSRSPPLTDTEMAFSRKMLEFVLHSRTLLGRSEGSGWKFTILTSSFQS